jgi:hypothetical protein
MWKTFIGMAGNTGVAKKKKKMINLGYFNIVGLDVQKGEFYGSAIFPAQKNKKRNED